MRAIVRFSLNNDYGSRLRNRLAPHLERHGLTLQRQGRTSTYEGYIDEADLRNALRDFWHSMASYMGRATLDHFWMYSDNQQNPMQGGV